MFGAPTFRRIRHSLERELEGVPAGQSAAHVLKDRARRHLQLLAQDFRGKPMRAVHERRLRAELSALIPWPAEDHERRLLEGHLVAATDAPLVSVIIPVYGKLDYTLRCLVSLGAGTERTPFEIIVVDDCSPDATPDVLSRVPGIRYLRNEENGGFIASCNRGAREARGRYLHFLNNDTVALPGWLDRMVETIESVPRAGLVGSRLIYPNFDLQEAGGVVWNDASATNWGNGRDPFSPAYNTLRDADYCSGASLLVARALFTRLGGFDSHYAPAYYEDTDLAFKVRAEGLRVLYQPASRIIHYEGATSGTDTSAGTKRYQVINRERFRERWASVLAGHGHHGDISPEEIDRVSGASVLVLDSRTPKPDHDSGSVDLANLLRVLRRLGCRTTFVPVFPLPRGLPVPNVQPYAGRYTDDLQRIGIECTYLPYEPSMERLLRERGHEFDMVLLHRVRVADRFFQAVRRHCPNAKVVYNTVDLTYLREEREAAHKGSRLMAWKAADTRRRELGVIAKADASLVLSTVEEELLAREVPGARIRVAPLLRDVPGLGAPRAGRQDVLFVGHFKHRPNLDAVEFLVNDIWPHVRERLPGVRLNIVGSNTTRAVEALAADDVIVHGFVEDLDAMFQRVRVSTAPLRFGAGLKGKVAESLGHGVPCVSTSVGVEGSGLRDEQELLVADDAVRFAEAIARVYRDDALWDRLSDAGVTFVRERYSLEAHADRFRTLFAELGVEAQK